jgi:RNA polymerase sigma-54 factor
MLDEVAGRESGWSAVRRNFSTGRARAASRPRIPSTRVDFGSYFQDYLDPGYRTQPEYEESEKPSFENFLSQPTTLSDHLAWQLGALTSSAICLRRPSS